MAWPGLGLQPRNCLHSDLSQLSREETVKLITAAHHRPPRACPPGAGPVGIGPCAVLAQSPQANCELWGQLPRKQKWVSHYSVPSTASCTALRSRVLGPCPGEQQLQGGWQE